MVEEWSKATIGDFLEFKNGLNKSKDFFGYGTPIINYTDVYQNRELRRVDIQGKVCVSAGEIQRFDVKKNDVFFTRTSETPEEVGISAVLLEDIDDCTFSGFVLRGRPKNALLLPEYCKYCFSTSKVRNDIIKNCTYTTRALTNGKQLSAIEIPVPSYVEQEAIAQMLSDIDRLISDLELLLDKKKDIFTGMVQDLICTKKKLDDYEGVWISKKIGELTCVYAGGTPSTLVKDYWGGNIPWMNSGELNLKIVRAVEGRITELGLDNSSTRLVPSNCVLIGLAGQGKTRGTAAYNTFPLCTNQSIAAIYPNDSLFDSKYLYYFMNTQYEKLRELSSGGGGRGGLNKKMLEEYVVSMPKDINEQHAIAEILTIAERDIEVLDQKKEKYQMLKKAMMTELLTGKTRLV